MKTIQRIKQKKKFNIAFDGHPDPTMQEVGMPASIGVCPKHYSFIKSKVIISIGDEVQRGQALFYDKKNPQVYFHSPVAGTVSAIDYGPQRTLERVTITPSSVDQAIEFQPVNIPELSVSEAKSALLERGLWTSFIELPFQNIPSPEVNPPAIVVMLSNPEPFHPKLSVVNDHVDDDLVRGIQLLKKITPRVIVAVDADESLNCDALAEIAQVVRISGDFSLFDPASVVYHLKDNQDENKTWACDWQSCVKIGNTIHTQAYFNQHWITVGGNQVENNRHYKVIEGTQVDAVVTKDNPNDRMIFGGLFSGLHMASEDYLPLGVDAINIIDSDPQPEFMSFIHAGLHKVSYTRAYVAGLLHAFRKTPTSTALHGSHRDCISCGLCTHVCPIDTALPQHILRSLKGNDVESAMKYGLLDCSSCGVCTYVCPSKIDLASMFTEAKDQLYREVNA